MTTQEHAFRAYYASMTDADLLRLAANKSSFVDIAQRLLGEELARRRLEFSPRQDAPVPTMHPGAFAKLMKRLHLH